MCLSLYLECAYASLLLGLRVEGEESKFDVWVGCGKGNGLVALETNKKANPMCKQSGMMFALANVASVEHALISCYTVTYACGHNNCMTNRFTKNRTINLTSISPH